jgi:hypothetical protein
VEIPFGGTLRFDGKCLSYDPREYPDGVYGRFVVKGGKVVKLLPEKVPAYTPPPCPPGPEPCDGCEGEVALSDDPDNLSALDAEGKLVTKIVTSAVGDVRLAGYGNAASPLRVVGATSGGGAAPTVVSGSPDILDVTPAGVISHKPSAGANTTINGIEFDAYGHAVGGSDAAPPTGGVTALEVNADALTKLDNNGGVLLSLPVQFGAEQTIATGRQEIAVDMYGRVTDFREALIDELDSLSTVIAGGWDVYDYDFGIFYPGYLRVSYSGDLGFNTLNAWGLGPLVAGVTVKLNGISLQAFIRYDSGRAVGIEARTLTQVAGDVHRLTLTVPAPVPVSAVGLLDVTRCR